MNLLKKKKGDIPNLLVMMLIIIFVVGVVAVLFSKIFIAVGDELKQTPGLIEDNNSVDTINTVETKTIPFLDYLFFFSFVGILIGLIISAIFIDSHPALIFVFVILLVIVIVLASIFSNIFTEVGSTETISSTYEQFTMTKAIFSNLPLLMLVAGAIIIIILFGKSRSGGSFGA